MLALLAATQDGLGINGPAFLQLLFGIFMVAGIACGYMNFVHRVVERRKIHFLRRVSMGIFLLAAPVFLVGVIISDMTLCNVALSCFAVVGAGHFLALVLLLLGWSKSFRGILHKLRHPRALQARK